MVRFSVSSSGCVMRLVGGSGWYNEEHSRHDKDSWNECWSCNGIGIDELDWHWDWDILTEFLKMKKRLGLYSEIEARKLKQLSEV